MVKTLPVRHARTQSAARLWFASMLLALLVGALLWPVAARAQESADSATVDESITRLNVRSGPDSTFEIVGKLPAGSTLQVLGADESGAWLRVTADTLDGEGWVAAEFVEISATTTPTPSLTPSPAKQSTPGGLAGAANLAPRRALPIRPANTPTATTAPNAKVLTPTVTPTPLATEETVAPEEIVVSAATVVAAVVEAPTATAGDDPARNVVEPDVATASVVPETINVRSGPGTAYSRVGSVAQGADLEITGVSPAGDWYRVNLADGSEGWVFSGLVEISGPVESVTALTDAEIPAAPVAQAASEASVASIASAPAPTGGGGFGYGVTANMWQSDKAAVANALNDLGFPWVKQQVRWEFVEPAPGAVNWQEMDDIVNTMNGYGLNVAFSVVTAPAWTRPTKGGANGPPEDFNQFARFLGQVAGRYCGQSLRAIEVWNEQNLQREWEGFPLDPALYMDLLKRAYASIKQSCPSMVVVSGATTPAGYSSVAFDDIDYLRGMYQNGLARYSDAVGIHPSGFANPPSVRFSDWQSGAYTALSHADHRSFYFRSTLEESRAVMEQFGDSAKKLWPTEFGWGSTSSPYPGYEYQARINEGQQAQWITDAFRMMADSGYVGAAFLWNLNYNYGEMQTFSVLGRPAYDALKSMTGH